MASTCTPITCTLYFSNTPALASSAHRFNPDCPPRFGSNASGLSFAIICSRRLTFNGSMYVTSAISGSVIIVAGFEFTNTISYPKFRRALQA